MMEMPKVLVLGTGGTVSQKRGKDGVFRPADEPYIKRVRNLDMYAKVTFEQVANIDITNMTTPQGQRLQSEFINHIRIMMGLLSFTAQTLWQIPLPP